jgi:hypothetical protein
MLVLGMLRIGRTQQQTEFRSSSWPHWERFDLGQHKIIINVKKKYDRNNAYKNLTVTYVSLERTRWKLENASKREDKGRIPTKTLEDAYRVFGSSSEIDHNAFHTIVFATREEMNMHAKKLGSNLDRAFKDVYDEYDGHMEKINQHLIEYDTHGIVGQKER